MKKVFIVGAQSQMGQTLKSINSNYTYLDREQLNLQNLNTIQKFFKSNPADIIVNFAAYTKVDDAESHKDEAALLNALAPAELAKSSKTIIHLSTDYVFSGKQTSPIKEDEPTGPISEYGRSKLDGEKNIRSVNSNSRIIRTSWLYSPYRENFVKKMLELAKKRDSLGVVNDQKGAPTYALDLARVIDAVIKNPESLPAGSYHYSNSGECTWYEFAQEIFAIKNIKINLKPILTHEYPVKAVRPAYSVFDKSKIQKTMGIDIPDWKVSLRDCLSQL